MSVEERASLTKLAFALQSSHAMMDEQRCLAAEKARQLGREAALAAQVDRLAADARLESEQAAVLQGTNLFVLARMLAGDLQATRRREENEAMQAALRLLVARQELDECRARLKAVEKRLAGRQHIAVLHNDLLGRKAILLKRMGDPRLAELEPLVQSMASMLNLRRNLRQASDLAATCRAAVAGLLTKSPRGGGAGKTDIALDGVFGWVSTRAKYRNLDDYNGDIMALRDLLRDLDASPVVDVADLIEAVPLADVGPDLRSADHWSEFIGPSGTIDVAVAFLTRRPTEALRFLDDHLLRLDVRLAQRIAGADANLASLRERQQALLESI